MPRVAWPVPSDMLITWAPCCVAYRMPSSMAFAYRELELYTASPGS